jgi:dolichyl-phosphate-mannose--protein O-mannosyl transferase
MVWSVVSCFLFLRAKHAGGIPNVESLQPFFTRIAFCLAAYWWCVVAVVGQAAGVRGGGSAVRTRCTWPLNITPSPSSPLTTARRNLIPYVFVKRSCFLYHYIPGLLYGELMLAMMIDKLSGACDVCGAGGARGAYRDPASTNRSLHLRPALPPPYCHAASAGKRRDAVVKVALFVVVTTYLFYAPWVYAMPLTSEGHDRRRWLKRWN